MEKIERISVNSGFINRLVGTSIVVIAAIVFIPNILDGEKVHYKEGFKAIPERPEFKTINLQEEIDNKVAEAEQPKQPEVEDIKADDAQLTQVEEPKQLVEASTEQPDAKVIEQHAKKAEVPARAPQENLSKMAYVIQLGSFSHKPNVKSLLSKLNAKGFKTFTKPVKTANGTLTKVFVGPSLNKSELESKLPQLKELTKLNGKVTQFEITK